MLALAPLSEVGGRSYLDHRWFDRYRWNTLPLFFTIPPKQKKGIWTRVMSFITPTSAGCTLEMVPALDLSLMTLKDANPPETLDQARSTLNSQQRSSWMAARASLFMRPSMVEALWKLDLQGNWAEGYSQYDRIPLRIWPSTPQVWYYHAPHMTAFLMLPYAIYCLRTAPVNTCTKDTAIHSSRTSMFPLPWSGIASIWHSSSSQAPWGAVRSAPMQHLKVYICRFMCPHPRRHVRWIRRPRECAFCAVFIPPHSLLTFPLAALQSTLVVLESQAQHLSPGVCCLDCNRILYLVGAYFIDDGNIEVAWQCSSIGTRQLLSHL